MPAPRFIGQPEPGYYKRRLVAGGPWVSVKFFPADGEIAVEVDGALADPKGKPFDVYDQWATCWPSSESEYQFFCQLRDWAQRFEPRHPAARPRAPIDLHTLPPRRRVR